MRVFGQPSLTSSVQVWGVLAQGVLLAGVLAVIAGLFGMHVMTGGHASHAVSAHGGATGHLAAADDGGRQPGGTAHPGGDAVVVLSAGALCGEACPGAEEAGAQCIPSASAGALTMLAPPAPAAGLAPPGFDVAPPAYSYVPTGPTPCELSISRT